MPTTHITLFGPMEHGCGLHDDSRYMDFFIDGYNPPDYTSGTTLPAIVWDILSYQGVSTATLEGIANDFFVESLTSVGYGSSDMNRTLDLKTWDSPATLDLDQSIPYYDADGSVDGVTSGFDSRFSYRFEPIDGDTWDLRLLAQAKILYAIQSSDGSLPFYEWAGPASLFHTVNILR